MFSWLVVGVLQANADWVGIAQSALMLPSILLVLLGGVVADRSDRRSLLLVLHLVAAGLSGCLVLIVAQGWLSMSLLIGYALCMGTVQAFAMPARDALLSEVAGSNMLRAVAGMTLTQWVSQALGRTLGRQRALAGHRPCPVYVRDRHAGRRADAAQAAASAVARCGRAGPGPVWARLWPACGRSSPHRSCAPCSCW